jgi:hypothetical protein
MSQAEHDENRNASLLGVDSTLFRTPTTVAVDPTTHEVLVKTNVLLPTGGSNPSLVLSYTGDNLTTIQKVIGGVTYTQTLGYDGSNNLISISAWS